MVWGYTMKYSNVQADLFKFLSRVKSEMIYGGHITALLSPAILVSVSILLNKPIDLPIALISYLMPLIVYSYDYYCDISKDRSTNPERAGYIENKVKSYPILIAFYISCLIGLLVVFGNLWLSICVFILVIGGIVYGHYIKDITKKIPGFKNIFTAIIWASTATFLLFFYESLNFTLAFVQIFNFIYFKVVLNVIFFDLKDIEGDKKHGLKTLPVMLGNDGTLRFLQFLNFFSFLPLFIGIYTGLLPVYSLSLILLYFYDFYYLFKANGLSYDKIRNVSCMLADVEFLFWPLILIISKSLYYSI